MTDIHGNLPALEAVLNQISQDRVEHIFCLGDVVGIGPDSNEVLGLLYSRDDISYVVGNHDLAVVAAFKQEDPPKGHQDERGHHQWLADRIEAKYVDKIAAWPKQISLRIDKQRLLFTHYHLDPNDWFLPIDPHPHADRLEQLYSNTDYTAISFGHHHIVHEIVSDKRVFFNPGSLGCYHRSFARYGVIQLDGNRMTTECREVPYNNKDFLRSYHKLEVPDREFILEIFHGGQLKEGHDGGG